MIPSVSVAGLLPLLLAAGASALEFVVSGGQIFTPGLVVVDSPQPGTPLGGGEWNGQLSGERPRKRTGVLTGEDRPSPRRLGRHGERQVTAAAISRRQPESNLERHHLSVQLQHRQEFHGVERNLDGEQCISRPSHVPGAGCHGEARQLDVARLPSGRRAAEDARQRSRSLQCEHRPGTHPHPSSRPTVEMLTIGQISIRQNYRLNGVDHYTIFDLPISITNSIEPIAGRPRCDMLDNRMLAPEQINMPAANGIGVLFAPGDGTVVQTKTRSGIGGGRPQAGPGDGLGSGGVRSWRSGALWTCAASMALALAW